MKWNILLLVLAAWMSVLSFGVERFGYLSQAEAMAEDLAPQVGVDKYVLWDNINAVLKKRISENTSYNWVPWVVVSIFLMVRIGYCQFKKSKGKPRRNMKWDILLLVFSLAMVAHEAIFEDYGYFAQPETIAEDLAIKSGVDKDSVTAEVKDIFARYRPTRVLFNCGLWAIFSFIVLVRFVLDTVNLCKSSTAKR